MKTKIINSETEQEKLKEYMKKKNHNFIKNPNFKYKSEIINAYCSCRYTDIFEIYTSYKDMKLYIASSNIDNYNLDIFSLLDNKKILSLTSKDQGKMESSKYYFNKKNKNEYLVSIDDWETAYIWDISNNYQLKYKFEFDSPNCILLFLENNNDYIIIASIESCSCHIGLSTQLYSLNDGSFIEYIGKTNKEQIEYLLYWYNKKNNINYIIQLAHWKIIINDFLGDKLYAELVNNENSDYNSGFIYNKDNNEYLYASLNDYNGIDSIEIWDLLNKNIFKIFKFIDSFINCIIRWNYRYILICDAGEKYLKVFDLENEKVISKIKKGEKCIESVKKILSSYLWRIIVDY